jgi:endoglucanase
MDWLLTMQDADGGVFFKLTTKNFEGMVMPEEAVSQRYIIGKSTTATLDFAAAAAKCYTNFHKIDISYAQRCLAAAVRAWEWARQNPEVAYRNPEDISTGQYGDRDFELEFFWAAAELYIATGDQHYLSYLSENSPKLSFGPGNSWNGFMEFLGAFALIDRIDNVHLVDPLKVMVLELADELVGKVSHTAYFQPFENFQWGSNSDQMNAGVLLAQAYRIDPRPEYINAVYEIADYIFGKNATGYSFLTGYGDRTPQFIHHRPSSADEIAEPVPGLLSGGPNSSKQDRQYVNYPENEAPMQCWADQEPSYASNEICLNWNAPLTYVLGFLEFESTR